MRPLVNGGAREKCVSENASEGIVHACVGCIGNYRLVVVVVDTKGGGLLGCSRGEMRICFVTRVGGGCFRRPGPALSSGVGWAGSGRRAVRLAASPGVGCSGFGG